MPVEKTHIDKTLSVKQIVEKYNIPRTTAHRSKQRGYLAKRTKTVCVSEKEFDYETAKRAARCVFFNKIKFMFPNPLDVFDDLQQEAILRCFEVAGRADSYQNLFAFYCKVSEFAMFSYLLKIHLLGPLKGRIVSFDTYLSKDGEAVPFEVAISPDNKYWGPFHDVAVVGKKKNGQRVRKYKPDRFCLMCGEQLILKNATDVRRKKFCNMSCSHRWVWKNGRKAKIRMVEIDGQQKPLTDLVEEYGITYNTVRHRLRRGWNIEDALTKPVNTKHWSTKHSNKRIHEDGQKDARL